VLCTVVSRAGVASRTLGVVTFEHASFYGSAVVARDFAGAACNRLAPLETGEMFVFAGDVLRGQSYTAFLRRWRRPVPRQKPPEPPSDIMVAALTG
jgi:hypothetical protein